VTAKGTEVTAIVKRAQPGGIELDTEHCFQANVEVSDGAFRTFPMSKEDSHASVLGH
jgi:hypothetical protein